MYVSCSYPYACDKDVLIDAGIARGTLNPGRWLRHEDRYIYLTAPNPI